MKTVSRNKEVIKVETPTDSIIYPYYKVQLQWDNLSEKRLVNIRILNPELLNAREDAYLFFMSHDNQCDIQTASELIADPQFDLAKALFVKELHFVIDEQNHLTIIGETGEEAIFQLADEAVYFAERGLISRKELCTISDKDLWEELDDYEPFSDSWKVQILPYRVEKLLSFAR